jgi:hypothetical protein
MAHSAAADRTCDRGDDSGPVQSFGDPAYALPGELDAIKA